MHTLDMNVCDLDHEIAPERMAAAVSNADHCQIGPLGRRTLADLRDFFLGAVLLVTVFLITSPPIPSLKNGKGAGV